MCILRWSDSNHTNAGSARVAVPVSNTRERPRPISSAGVEKRKKKEKKNQASTVLLEAFFAGKVFPLRKIRSSLVLLSLPCVVALLENGSTHNIARATLKFPVLNRYGAAMHVCTDASVRSPAPFYQSKEAQGITPSLP